MLKNGNENIIVRRAKPDFTAFVGSFNGTSRTMVVNGDGLVFESVSNARRRARPRPVADVTYQLSEPRVEKGVAHAQAIVTKVKIYDRKAFKGRIPRVGDTGTFRLEKGVVRSPFIGRLYCDGKAQEGHLRLTALPAGTARPIGRRPVSRSTWSLTSAISPAAMAV